MIEILFFTLLGVGIGCITGIIPGMHLNNFLPILIALVPLIGVENTCSLIISIAISQNFFSFFSSTFLGAPDESTALNVLPAHRLLMEGKGLSAIFYQATGALFASLFSFFLIFVCFSFFENFYSITRPFIPWILILVTILMILSEKGFRKLLSFFITLLSATLGFITLNLFFVKNSIFPLLSGFFGVSTLLISLKNQVNVPKQKLKIEKSLSKKVCS
jgi:putative membrane protein